MQKASHRDPIIMMQHVEMYFGSRCILPETSIEFFPGDRTLLVGPS